MNEDLELEARTLVRDADFETIKKIAKDVRGVNLSLKPDELRAVLAGKAKTEPVVIINASKDVKLQRKVAVKEAEELQLIVFTEKERVWYWNDSAGDDVMRVEVGENHFDALVEFLSSPEGSKQWTKLKKDLRKLAQPA